MAESAICDALLRVSGDGRLPWASWSESSEWSVVVDVVSDKNQETWTTPRHTATHAKIFQPRVPKYSSHSHFGST